MISERRAFLTAGAASLVAAAGPAVAAAALDTFDDFVERRAQ